MALLLLPTVVGASAIFEFEGRSYRIVTDTADWETARLNARNVAERASRLPEELILSEKTR